ncbi:hypothetical protein CANCADRAFT_3829 [Tortispora caseinolytica NRRL Y-17796]|uniref:RING-type domain-containing protein n=1 Tax=Tortispora caseinolytica NRRL Y-17796 TaxID=767744 RepID=A0A1E4TC30_9ASCO|nr:hypothetical protein CANCADRAFT_3829 [Tortispora caseinolytica NRRL Y-17796]
MNDTDESLICSLCKDIYEGPVVAPCGHTFCSTCIRRSIVKKEVCPVCSIKLYESQLKPADRLRELVNLRYSQDKSVNESRTSDRTTHKRKRSDNDNDHDNDFDDHQQSSLPSEQHTASRNDPGFLAFCPLCSGAITVSNVESHAGVCPGRKDPREVTAVARRPISFLKKKQHANETRPTQDTRPAHIRRPTYASMSVKEMKSFCAEYSIHDLIPKYGLLEKNRLQDMIEEWISLYNGNIDNASVRSHSELKSTLESWVLYKFGDKIANNASIDVTSAQFNKAAWIEMHNDLYRELIKNAKSTYAKAENKHAVQKLASTSTAVSSDQDLVLASDQSNNAGT